jgi:predicted small lipoprotein YifL
VKPIFDLSRIAMIAILLTLAACGQKGPLFMPAELPPAVKTAEPAVTTEKSIESAPPAQPKTPDIPTTPAIQ